MVRLIGAAAALCYNAMNVCHLAALQEDISLTHLKGKQCEVMSRGKDIG
jgi:hypothetical protein